jgi:hypothetical protein
VTVAALVAQIEALQRRVEILERGSGPRDAEDRALQQLLPTSTRELPFRSGDLMKHAEQDPQLCEALADALIDNPYELGNWLSRMKGNRDGVSIVQMTSRRWRAISEKGRDADR